MTTTQLVEVFSQLNATEMMLIYWYMFKSSIFAIAVPCVIFSVFIIILNYINDEKSRQERREKKKDE